MRYAWALECDRGYLTYFITGIEALRTGSQKPGFFAEYFVAASRFGKTQFLGRSE
jgi:hypothetical protein